MDIYEIFDELKIPYPRCYSDCPPGWFKLAKNCLEEMIAAGWDKKLEQFKEKFGGLRIYIRKHTDELDAIITKYSALAYQTCNRCGSDVNVTTVQTGWWETLCETCKTTKLEIE